MNTELRNHIEEIYEFLTDYFHPAAYHTIDELAVVLTPVLEKFNKRFEKLDTSSLEPYEVENYMRTLSFLHSAFRLLSKYLDKCKDKAFKEHFAQAAKNIADIYDILRIRTEQADDY